MVDIHKAIGLTTAPKVKHEITYEQLTQQFDGCLPTHNLLVRAMNRFDEITSIEKGLMAQNKAPMREETIRKLAFLFRLVESLRKMGIKDTKLTLPLELITWLKDEV
mgnify:CR=1 FL=1